MEALIPALVAAGLAEFCGRMPMLAAALGRRFPARPAVPAGLAIAAFVNVALGVVGGAALGRELPHSAARLLVGIALALSGTGGLFRPKPVGDPRGRSAFLAASAGALVLGFGEAAQFVAAALAAASGTPVATAIGAAIGMVAAATPAAVLGAGWPVLRSVRIGIGAGLIVAGTAVAVSALEIG